jgi:hypothetical protein
MQVGRSQRLLASSSSGLAVTYQSLSPDVCFLVYPTTGPVIQTVNDRVEANEWNCSVRATQAGDSRYSAATSVDQSFKYFKAPMVLQVENSSSLSGAGPHAIVTRVRMVDNAAMSGLTSLGHLLNVTNQSSSICRIDSHGTWDRTGGIVNRTYLTALSNGICSLKFDFPGTKDRAPVSLTWNANSIMPVDTATYIEPSIAGSVLPATGYQISRSSIRSGILTIDFAVRAQDSKLAPVANSGRLSTSGGAGLNVSFQTSAICSIRSASRVLGEIFRVSLRLNGEGTCTLQANFPGVNSMKYLPSALTWSATITK